MNVVVTDSSGQEVYNGLSGSDGKGVFKVPALPIGTYTVTLIDDRVVPLPFSREQLENTNTPFVLQDKMTATVEIAEDTEIKKLYWIMVSKSKQVMSYSLHGEFPNGSQGVDQNGAAVSYRVWYKGGDWPQSYTNNNNRQFIFFPGVLVSDTLGMYAGYSTIPTLSAEEEAYGWTFQGWRVNGSDRIYTLEEITRITITEDIQLEAAWTAPNHNVTFVTDIEKGDIAGQASVNYNIEGNSSTVSDATTGTLPEVSAKEGYTFLGWYVNNSTNLVNDNDILSTNIQKDLVYYAKYKKDNSDITIGINGNWYINGVDTGKPSKGDKGDAGAPGDRKITSKTMNHITSDPGTFVSQVTKGMLPNTGDEAMPILSILGIVFATISVYFLGVFKFKK